ncbi:hypothetical protein BWQ96_07675 [Gracilariopsis chorda]|uniref:Uncharacterized protein n=1 Tax=Gracilariopsis chorda TaxID=448386 RepID=A0A2V3IN83_9FLOR|nr:hypothetical protein BWQ96_07675 [Gracilariopsis chorda]|eukprot:PXF42580.1 hypothetical protein BWQ96_07675 [Gracilariopsis chorda]
MSSFSFHVQPRPDGLIIPLRPLTTQLLFTIVSALSEIGLISAVLVILTKKECHTLSTERPVSIKSHSLRWRLIPVVAMLMFIALETLVSVHTKTHIHHVKNSHKCVQVDLRTSEALEVESSLNKEEEAVMLNCVKMTPAEDANFNIEVYPGNYSRSGEKIFVDCSADWLMKYKLDTKGKGILEPNAEQHCRNGFCVFLYSQESKVFFSPPLPSARFNHTNEYTGYWTEFIPGAVPSLNSTATYLLLLYQKGILEEIQIRRKLFMSAERGQCEMTNGSKEHTLVPYWLISITALSWFCSAILFALTRVLKSGIFYNISDPLHWTRRTYWAFNEGVDGKVTHFRSCLVDGVRRVYLCREYHHAEPSDASDIAS